MNRSKWNLQGKTFARYTHKERFQQAHKRHGRTKTRRCTRSWDVQGRRSSKTVRRGLGIIPPGPVVAGIALAAGEGAAGRRITESGCAAEGWGRAAGAAGGANAEAERGWAAAATAAEEAMAAAEEAMGNGGSPRRTGRKFLSLSDHSSSR